MGSWASWGRERRALVVLRIATWLGLGTLAAIAIVLEDERVLLPALALLPLDWWVSGRLSEAEYAEGTLADIDDTELTAAERELLGELDASGGDRAANLLIVRKWLEGDDVLRRYEYPTRELLALRSASEAIELLGAAIILLTTPAVAGVVIGLLLLLLGGRTGAGLARAVLGDRLYRTPVGDEVRTRWLKRESRLVVGAAVLLLAVAAQRFLL